VVRDGAASSSAQRVTTWASPPLAQLVATMNGESNNHFAELLFRNAARTDSVVGSAATGKASMPLISGETSDGHAALRNAVTQVCLELAQAIVRDGEGATKFITIQVEAGGSEAECRKVAFAIAHSPLVKTALFGEDANWGRILAAAGRSGAALDPGRVDIFIGPVQMVSKGIGCGKDVEAAATGVLKTEEFSITVDLHLGPGRAVVYTCDLSIDYVKINADYRS
jgi:glutamate N-acetyltransferase/amino-acid N-acetyltransferase